jgi:hypothetical protein
MVQPTLNVVDRDLIDVTVNTINPNGATTSANSQPVVIASDQSAVPVSVASLPLPSGAATSAKQDTANASLASIDGKTLVAGQALMAASMPVTIASNQSALDVNVASIALPTGASTSANQATEIASLASIDGKITAVNTGAVVVSSSALPTGAATAVRQDTGNTSLGSIDTKIVAVDTTDVTITTIPLPPGAATAAKQDTGNGSLGSIDSKITAVNTGNVTVGSSVLPTGASTSALQTTGNASLASLDTKTTVVNTDSVTVTMCALPADAATETTLALIDGSLVSVIKVEDVASVSGDSGIMTLAVRRDANTSLVDATGDYAPLQVDATGSLKVAIISGAGSGGTAMVDDTAFTPATSSVTPMGAFFNDTAPDSVNEGDIGAPRMSANRNLFNTIRDAAGNERGVNVTAGNALTVDGSATTQPVSAASLPLPTGASTEATLALAYGEIVNGNTTRNTMNTKMLNPGQANMANSSPVVIASDQSAIVIAGNRTNNNAAPGTTLQATMAAIANATIPTVTEGNAVLLSTDLSQRLRVLNEQDVFITGQAAQSASGNNIFLAVAGTGSTDTALPDGSPSYRSFNCQIVGTAGIASGAVTFEGSNDNTTFVAILWNDDAVLTGAVSNVAITIAASTSRFFSGKCSYRYIRCRISTVFAGGTIRAYTRFSTADYVPRSMIAWQSAAANLQATVSATNLSCNVAQIAGQVPVIPQTNGATNRSLVVALAGPSTFADYSAQAWAAASGNGATIANTNGTGAGIAYDVNLTVFTPGASTGLVVVLQESPDNGTTWYDIWHCEPITTPSHIFIPALPINGRRRMRWENLTGAATTATVTVTAMDLSFTPIKQVQYFDRTAGVGSGTATSGTNSAAYTIAACKAITVVIETGTATAPASWKVQMTNMIAGGAGAKWYDASASTSCPASSMTVIPLTAGVYGKSIRLVCTATGTTALVTALHIYGTN